MVIGFRVLRFQGQWLRPKGLQGISLATAQSFAGLGLGVQGSSLGYQGEKSVNNSYLWGLK